MINGLLGAKIQKSLGKGAIGLIACVPVIVSFGLSALALTKLMALEPEQRSQLGAHYTSEADIKTLVEPVLMAPLRRLWAAVQSAARELARKRDAAKGAARTRLQNQMSKLLRDFADQVAGTVVLDPACGSGNFLYVSLTLLKDLEQEVIAHAASTVARRSKTPPSHP